MTVLLVEIETEYQDYGKDYKLFADTEKGIEAAIGWIASNIPYSKGHTEEYWGEHLVKPEEFAEKYGQDIHDELSERGYWSAPYMQYSTKISITREEVQEE